MDAKDRETSRVLIVDDEEVIRRLLKDYFNACNIEADCAGGLSEAKAFLAERRYTVVVSDLQLTEADTYDGFKVAAAVQETWPGTPVIMLTAHGSTSVEKEARQTGVSFFLHKPTPLADIAQIVLGFIGGGSPTPRTPRSIPLP